MVVYFLVEKVHWWKNCLCVSDRRLSKNRICRIHVKFLTRLQWALTDMQTLLLQMLTKVVVILFHFRL